MGEDKAHLLASLLLTMIKRNVKPEVLGWLQEKGNIVREGENKTALSSTFAAVPRKTGRALTEISDSESGQVDQLYNGFTVRNWPIDKLCRLWLLLQVNSEEENVYHASIDSLFRDAEMNELVALYSFLPVFEYPASWQLRAAEGIRSNIGSVPEAIMYENPYPYKYLSEPSWNQLILKAFFTDKDVTRIMGLDLRANKTLATILIDYAHERQAAHRSVNPQLWRLVSKFIDEHTIEDIEKLFDDGHITERRAAVLACYHSDYEPARRLLDKEPGIYAAVKANQLSWNLL